MSTKVGVIAEDRSDVDVLDAVIRRVSPNARFGISAFLGRGCGKIKSKCRAWAEQLRRRGCGVLILMHDLDEADMTSLRQELTTSLTPCPIASHIITIPVREIEAWLLSDAAAIQAGMKIRTKIPRVAEPENDVDPKRTLARIIYRCSGKTKRYLNTVHNRLIAAELSVAEVRRCKAFRPLETFVRQYVI